MSLSKLLYEYRTPIEPRTYRVASDRWTYMTILVCESFGKLNRSCGLQNYTITMAEFKKVELFGGAIVAEFPKAFGDVRYVHQAFAVAIHLSRMVESPSENEIRHSSIQLVPGADHVFKNRGKDKLFVADGGVDPNRLVTDSVDLLFRARNAICATRTCASILSPRADGMWLGRLSYAIWSLSEFYLFAS